MDKIRRKDYYYGYSGDMLDKQDEIIDFINGLAYVAIDSDKDK